MEQITFTPGDASRVHYATDPRIRALAESAWRLKTGGSHMDWLTLGKDHPDNLIPEAREWVRAAVAGGVMPPPDASRPAVGTVPAGSSRPFDALCSFCGVTSERVSIVQGPGVGICGDCIELVTITHQETQQSADAPGPDRYCPRCERIENTATCPNRTEDGWV